MGAYQNNGDQTRKSSKKRGSVRNTARLEAFATGSGQGGASWGDCDSGLLQAVVDGITALGGAVTFGLSRDLGAHSLTLMLDGERQPLWYNGDADLDDELKAVGVTKVLATFTASAPMVAEASG